MWAGPTHWKFKFIRSRHETTATCDTGAPKAKRAKVVVHEPVNFAEAPSEDELKKLIRFGDRRITRKTLTRTSDGFTLPEDMQVSPDFLFQTNLNPNLYVSIFLIFLLYKIEKREALMTFVFLYCTFLGKIAFEYEHRIIGNEKLLV